jgi:hypothetical protein
MYKTLEVVQLRASADYLGQQRVYYVMINHLDKRN